MIIKWRRNFSIFSNNIYLGGCAGGRENNRERLIKRILQCKFDKERIEI